MLPIRDITVGNLQDETAGSCQDLATMNHDDQTQEVGSQITPDAIEVVSAEAARAAT